jgi:hypothetical protein
VDRRQFLQPSTQQPEPPSWPAGPRVVRARPWICRKAARTDQVSSGPSPRVLQQFPPERGGASTAPGRSSGGNLPLPSPLKKRESCSVSLSGRSYRTRAFPRWGGAAPSLRDIQTLGRQTALHNGRTSSP